MNSHKTSQRLAQASAVAMTLLAVSCAMAQTSRPRRTTTRPAMPAVPAKPPVVPGLDGFSDSAMVSTLYLHGAESLADRIVKERNLDPAVVNALRFPVLVRQLEDTKLTPVQQADLVQKIVAAVPLALPNMNDHRTIIRTATKLKEFGLQKGMELHEYWGEDQNDQKAAMKPVADATVKLVDRAIEVIDTKQESLLRGVPVAGPGAANNPALAEWQTLDDIKTAYKFNRPFFEYCVAAAMDPANPDRATLCDGAIDELSAYVQGGDLTATNETGKLQMTKGDHTTARASFLAVLAAPAPDGGDAGAIAQYNSNKDTAYYFAAVNEVLDKKLAAAQTAYQALLDWNKQSSGPRKLTVADKAALDAVARMLQFRIAILDANNAPNEDAKQGKVTAANKILLDLVTAYPQYRPTILDRLKNNLPVNPNLKTLDLLMLQAMTQGGSDVLAKNYAPEQMTPADYKALKSAAAASEELLTRSELSATDQAKYLFLAGIFWDKADEDMKAIDAYLRYMKQYPVKATSSDLEKRRHDLAVAGAVDSAGHWMRLNAAHPGGVYDPQDMVRYRQCVALAAQEGLNNPTYSPYIYVYGKSLVVDQNPPKAKEAILWLQKVPATDQNFRSARFWEMMSNKQLSQEAAKAKNDADMKTYAQRVVQLAPEVGKGFDEDAAKSTDDAQKNRFRRMSAQTDIEAADLAMKVMHDPPTALKFLDNIEEKLKDVPNSESLLAEALQIKIIGLLDAKQNDAAVEVLKSLVQKDPNKAFVQVSLVVEKLNTEYKDLETQKKEADKAGNSAASDQAREGMLNANTQLTALTDIALSKDVMPASTPAAQLAQWEGFRLVVLLRQAKLETDPDKKKALLQALVTAYDSLIKRSPDNLILKGAQADIYFELGDYAKARPVFFDFFSNSRYGQPTDVNAQGDVVPNERFWDLAYKCWKCDAEIFKADPSTKDFLDATVRSMKMHYVRFGPTLAGTNSRAAIDELRLQIAPGFDPAKYSNQAATTAPAVK